MRRFPLRPAGPGGSDWRLGITLPPAAPTPTAGEECVIEALWGPLQSLVPISVISPDPPTSGAVYADGVFTMVDSSNRFGEWEIDTSELTGPIACVVKIETGALDENITYFFATQGTAMTTTLFAPGNGINELRPYFILSPGESGGMNFYSEVDALDTPVTFRVFAILLAPP